ncbi:MAG: PUA domain-containing protein [Zestosphaera sp.]
MSFIVREATPGELESLRAILNYQLRVDVADKLLPDGLLVGISRNTGRIRALIDPTSREVLATIIAQTHTANLRLSLARRLHSLVPPPKLRLIVVEEMVQDLLEARTSVFSKHVIAVDEGLRAGDEALVVGESDELLCVGRLLLSPDEILQLLTGPALKIRECVNR